ncbi:hypothetical protein Ddc_24800 [Ditylenchus destructor]|nr:hypothetical protein Ddc_24800 [Ditylenchus destructor]
MARSRPPRASGGSLVRSCLSSWGSGARGRGDGRNGTGVGARRRGQRVEQHVLPTDVIGHQQDEPRVEGGARAGIEPVMRGQQRFVEVVAGFEIRCGDSGACNGLLMVQGAAHGGSEFPRRRPARPAGTDVLVGAQQHHRAGRRVVAPPCESLRIGSLVDDEDHQFVAGGEGTSAVNRPGRDLPQQPVVAAVDADGCVRRDGAVLRRRHGQPAAVDQPSREVEVPGERERRVAEAAADDVLVGGDLALARIAVEQRLRRSTLNDRGQLPHQVVGVLDAAVGAARAKRRDAVGRVAREQHAAVAEAVLRMQAKVYTLAQTSSMSGTAPSPPAAIEALAHQRAHARQDALGLLLQLGIGVPAELEVDAPHAVGLAMQQHALAGVKGRVEPEPALGGEGRAHAHVGDEEAVLEAAAVALLADQLAQQGARAVAGDDMIGAQRVGAVGRFDLERDMIAALVEADDAVMPAQVDQRQLERALDQEALDVVLLQIHEGRTLMAGLAEQVELVDLLVAEEDAAHAPGHALVDDALAAAQPVEDLQRPLGEAQRARSHREPAVVVQQHDGHALQREVDGGAQSHRARADDDHRMTRGLAALVGVLIGAAAMGIDDALIVDVGHRSALERVPHLLIALGRPDARVTELCDLVVGAAHVERHAVVEDHPLAVLGLELLVGPCPRRRRPSPRRAGRR